MVRHRYAGEEYEDAAQFKIKHRDYLNMKQLYVMMREWLIIEGYAPHSNDIAFPEELYLQRETQRSGREIWFWWRASKIRGADAYYKYELDVDVHVILLKDVEVMHQGQKFKTNWGQPEINIRARLIFDHKHEWRSHWFLKNFNEQFHRRIFKKDLEQERMELYRDAYRLSEAIKTFFKMKRFMPEPETAEWYPAKGLGDVR